MDESVARDTMIHVVPRHLNVRDRIKCVRGPSGRH